MILKEFQPFFKFTLWYTGATLFASHIYGSDSSFCSEQDKTYEVLKDSSLGIEVNRNDEAMFPRIALNLP